MHIVNDVSGLYVEHFFYSVSRHNGELFCEQSFGFKSRPWQCAGVDLEVPSISQGTLTGVWSVRPCI